MGFVEGELGIPDHKRFWKTEPICGRGATGNFWVSTAKNGSKMAVFGCSDPTWRAHCENYVRVDPPLVYTFWKLYPITFSKHINIWGLLHAHFKLYGYLCLPFVMNHPNFLSKRAASLRNGPISFFFRVGIDRKFILFWSFLMWGFQKCQIFNVIPHLTQVMPLASHALNFCKNCNMESHFHFFLYHHF